MRINIKTRDRIAARLVDAALRLAQPEIRQNMLTAMKGALHDTIIPTIKAPMSFEEKPRENTQTPIPGIVAAAKDATPGPWVSYPTTSRDLDLCGADGDHYAWTIAGGMSHDDPWGTDVLTTGAEGCEEDCISQADARYIAAVDPATVLGMIDRINEAERDLAEIGLMVNGQRLWPLDRRETILKLGQRLAEDQARKRRLEQNVYNLENLRIDASLPEQVAEAVRLATRPL